MTLLTMFGESLIYSFFSLTVGRLHFSGRTGLKLSAVQGAILLGMALQYKTVDMLQVSQSVSECVYMYCSPRVAHACIIQPPH